MIVPLQCCIASLLNSLSTVSSLHCFLDLAELLLPFARFLMPVSVHSFNWCAGSDVDDNHRFFSCKLFVSGSNGVMIDNWFHCKLTSFNLCNLIATVISKLMNPVNLSYCVWYSDIQECNQGAGYHTDNRVCQTFRETAG